MKEILSGFGCLIAIIATILSIAGFAFWGPLPLGGVFLIGYVLYKSK